MNTAAGFVELETPGQTPGRKPAVRLAFWMLKCAALWIVMLIASIAASRVVGHLPPVPQQDGPLSIVQGVLLVDGAIAIVLAMVASQARVRSVGLAVLLFVTLFCLQCGMMVIEALWFNNSVHMPLEQMTGWVTQALIVSAAVAATGALLFHPASGNAAAVPSNIFWRIMWLSAIYVVLYFAAGSLAWQSEALRSYYANMHVSLGSLFALQFVRGFLWAVISLFIVTSLNGSLTRRAATMALLFGVLTAGQLLLPNAMMPWSVRQVHLIEVGTSEMIYGIVATLVLMAGAARKPLSDTSAWRFITGHA